MHRKMKLVPSPTYPCSQEDQTSDHVLQRCPLHKVMTEDVWPVNTPLMTKLRLQAGAGEDDLVYLPNGPDRVARERQEEAEESSVPEQESSDFGRVHPWVYPLMEPDLPKRESAHQPIQARKGRILWGDAWCNG